MRVLVTSGVAFAWFGLRLRGILASEWQGNRNGFGQS